MTRVTSRRTRTGQMTLTVVPDVDTDDRAPWEGCVTGSLFDVVAPTPVTDLTHNGRALYRRGILQMNVAVQVLLARPAAADRETVLREFSTMQLRALAAKLGHPGYARATDVPKTWDGAFTAAAAAVTMDPRLGRDGLR